MEYESAFSGSGIWCCRKSQVWLAGATNGHAKHQSTFSQAYLYPSCIPRPPVYTLIFPRPPACFSSLRSLEASQVSVCPTSNFCHESFRVTPYVLLVCPTSGRLFADIFITFYITPFSPVLPPQYFAYFHSKRTLEYCGDTALKNTLSSLDHTSTSTIL